MLCMPVGKLKISSNDIERTNKMKKRLMYLSELLKVFGFKGINDFNTTIERDDNLVKRMENSGFMKYTKYKDVMEAFGKRMRKEINNTTTDLRSILNCEINYDLLAEAIKTGFEEHFKFKFEHSFAQVNI